MPRDLTGGTVLDIGRNAGFYSLEMKRRGADRVPTPAICGRRRYAAEVTGLAVELHQISVYSMARLGSASTSCCSWGAVSSASSAAARQPR
jgi:tRNA (mo5U34)-methyltransferase